ncbi:ArsR/SmtB family transcription factor [Ruania zhangjianzhongii]|uniref:ArsR/SmtB family transcription factor n=1 Tax=Ruania zhangjianzhongii TaxID=2603206 RepID=UPI0011CBE725|nr:winged helix-turn-helix domain-containing protein [Ruania zhangjianzhongii]
MADQTGDPDRSPPAHAPDYSLADGLTLEDPAQYRALFEETRQSIITLLSERAATITELAAALGKPKGTIGHHVQVLADAGLVHVVRTQQVRALVAKYWGRTARIFWYHRTGAAVGDAQRILERAAVEVGHLEEAASAAGREAGGILDVNRRDVRLPVERVGEFRDRLADLLVEFADQPRSGDVTYAMVYGVFRSEHAALPPAGEDG